MNHGTNNVINAKNLCTSESQKPMIMATKENPLVVAMIATNS
jgi:hypothetical protein